MYLAIMAMGSYSITRLFVTDSFPLFEIPRQWLFKRFPPDGHASTDRPPDRVEYKRTSNNIYVVTKGHFIGELISCPWCIGWWVSLAVTISFALIPSVTILILIPFALRAFVGGYANTIGGG
jgi:hypothetical protein